jgi:hypothetical protein
MSLMKFDTLPVLISQRNYQGINYEDSCLLISKYGRIMYNGSRGYKLAKRYKAVYINNRVVTIALEDYIILDEFRQLRSR